MSLPNTLESVICSRRLTGADQPTSTSRGSVGTPFNAYQKNHSACDARRMSYDSAIRPSSSARGMRPTPVSLERTSSLCFMKNFTCVERPPNARPGSCPRYTNVERPQMSGASRLSFLRKSIPRRGMSDFSPYSHRKWDSSDVLPSRISVAIGHQQPKPPRATDAKSTYANPVGAENAAHDKSSAPLNPYRNDVACEQSSPKREDPAYQYHEHPDICLSDMSCGAKKKETDLPTPHRKFVDDDSTQEALYEAESDRVKEVGNAQFRRGDYFAAHDAYTAAIQLNIGNIAAIANRAVCLFKLLCFEECEADCRRVLLADPQHWKTVTRLAKLCLFTGRYIEAKEQYDTALRLVLLFSEEKKRDCTLDFQQINTERQSIDTISHFMQKSSDGNWAAALNILNEGESKILFKEPIIFTQRMRALLFIDPVVARTELEQYLAELWVPNDVSCVLKGASGRHRGRLMHRGLDSLQDRKELLVHWENHRLTIKLLLAKANAYSGQHFMSVARCLATECVHLSPEFKPALDLLEYMNSLESGMKIVDSLAHAGKYSAAIRVISDAMELDVENRVVRSVLHVIRANLHLCLGSKVLAERDCCTAIRLHPDNAKAFLTRSRIRGSMGRATGAMLDLEHAAVINPEYLSEFKDLRAGIQNVERIFRNVQRPSLGGGPQVTGAHRLDDYIFPLDPVGGSTNPSCSPTITRSCSRRAPSRVQAGGVRSKVGAKNPTEKSPSSEGAAASVLRHVFQQPEVQTNQSWSAERNATATGTAAPTKYQRWSRQRKNSILSSMQWAEPISSDSDNVSCESYSSNSCGSSSSGFFCFSNLFLGKDNLGAQRRSSATNGGTRYESRQKKFTFKADSSVDDEAERNSTSENEGTPVGRNLDSSGAPGPRVAGQGPQSKSFFSGNERMSSPHHNGGDTLYGVLELDRFSSINQVRAQYKKLSLRYHPDRHVGAPSSVLATATQRIQSINHAHQILSDTLEKESYDRTL